MPKRRITAKQKAASRRNLVKARAARKKGYPRGKNLILYHQTTPEAAGRILKEGFKPQNKRGAYSDKVWFHTKRAAQQSLRDAKADMREYGTTQYGTAMLRVTVPRKAIKDKSVNARVGIGTYTVPFKNLHGRKVKRVR